MFDALIEKLKEYATKLVNDAKGLLVLCIFGVIMLIIFMNLPFVQDIRALFG